jgi:hypothetical protein
MVINNHGQVIGEGAVGAPDDEIAAACDQVLAAGPLNDVVKSDYRRIDPQPVGAGALADRQTQATGAGIEW